MTDHAIETALAVADEARREVESEEENVEVPSLLKDLDDVSLHEFDSDDDVDDLMKETFATDYEEIKGTVLTEEEDVEGVEKPEDADSYTELLALTEHDPDTVDPDEVAIESLAKRAQVDGLDGTTTVEEGGQAVRDAIERATNDIRSRSTEDGDRIFREALSYATEMATSKQEAAELAGNYVLKVTDDTKTAVKARTEAIRGFGKARQYVSDPSEAPDDVNCKEGPNGSLYYDPDERGRGNTEATGPTNNTLLDMSREELGKGMEIDPNDPDQSMQDAKAAAKAEKAVKRVADVFDVSPGRVQRFFKQAAERGVTDAESVMTQAEVVFGKQEITEGDEYYSQLNDTSVTVTEVDGDEVEVSTDNDGWTETVDDVQDKLNDGDWVPIEDHEESTGEKQVDPDEIEDPDDDDEEEMDIEGDPDEIEDPDDDGEEELDVDPAMDDPDEKQEEDPCWDGYVQVGMKEGEDGEMVPNCVPEDEADKMVENAVEEAFSDVGTDFKGRRYVSDPEDAPDDVEVQEGEQGGYYYETGDSTDDSGGGGMTDEELRDQTADAMHEIAEIDGVVNINGEERDDGYGITMDVSDDADPSEVATRVASVDGTTNITGEENEDGSVSISMDITQPVDDEDNPIDAAVEREFIKARRYVSDPEDAPDDVDVEEGSRGGYYYETEDLPGDEDAEDVDGGEDDYGPDEGQQEAVAEATEAVENLDGVNRAEGGLTEDGAEVTADLNPEEDVADTLHGIAAIDGTVNITAEPDGDGGFTAEFEVDPVLMDDETENGGSESGDSDDGGESDEENGDTELPDAIGDPSEEQEQELRDRTQDMIDEDDIRDRVNDFSAPMFSGAAAGAEARNEVANRVMGEITQGDELPTLRGDALESVQEEVYDTVEEIVDEEMDTDLAMSMDQIDAAIESAFDKSHR